MEDQPRCHSAALVIYTYVSGHDVVASEKVIGVDGAEWFPVVRTRRFHVG